MYGCIDESFKKSAKISDLRYCNTNTYFICQERTTDGFDPSIGRIGSGGPGPDAPRHEPADEPSRCGLRVNSVFANITINSDSATCRSVFPRMPQPPPLPERRSERCGRCAAGRPSGAAGCLSAGLRTGSYDEKSLFSQKIGPKFAGGGILLILHRP